MAAEQSATDEEYFRFTSGRWLWDEAPRMQERYKKFDVSALKTIAANSVGAQRCVSMLKMAEGGSNRIFRLAMDSQKTVIVWIPYPNHGSLLHAVASEVATMDFAATVLKIPVPRVLAWDAQSDNAVGTEYILMEEASGTPLHQTWDSLDLDTKSCLVDELVSISKKLLSVSFERQVFNKFHYTNVTISSANGPRRTGSNPSDYVKAVATREIRWLSDFADPKTHRQVYGNRPNPVPCDLIALQQKLLEIAEDLLPNEQQLVRPMMWHWDLHAPNIFVEGNKITAVIDWQDSWVGPLLLQNLRPRLLDFQGESMLRLPPDYPSLTDKEEKDKLCVQVEKSLLLWSFETPLKSYDPALKQIWALPQRDMIRDAIIFAVGTWESGAVPFREVLIRIRRNWHLFRPGGECPFEFSQDELAAHREEGKGFNETAEFWASISDLVTREGYVAKEDYEQALEMFRQLREQGLEVLSDDEKDGFERATRWAAR